MDLQKLIQTPDDQRDMQWEAQFLTALTNSQLEVISENPQTGPDGWPYLLVKTNPSGDQSAQKILEWLSKRGIGLAVNPDKELPDYILPFGMIWSFRETGLFFQNQDETAASTVELSKQTIKHAGTPHPKYLPDYVRSILREFLRDQAVLAPKILVFSLDGKNYELAFSLESLGNPPASEHAGIAEALGWFLPPHYSIVLVSEKDLPEFSPL